MGNTVFDLDESNLLDEEIRECIGSFKDVNELEPEPQIYEEEEEVESAEEQDVCLSLWIADESPPVMNDNYDVEEEKGFDVSAEDHFEFPTPSSRYNK